MPFDCCSLGVPVCACVTLHWYCERKTINKHVYCVVQYIMRTAISILQTGMLIQIAHTHALYKIDIITHTYTEEGQRHDTHT